jgi:hypothetical protein
MHLDPKQIAPACSKHYSPRRHTQSVRRRNKQEIHRTKKREEYTNLTGYLCHNELLKLWSDMFLHLQITERKMALMRIVFFFGVFVVVAGGIEVPSTIPFLSRKFVPTTTSSSQHSPHNRECTRGNSRRSGKQA